MGDGDDSEDEEMAKSTPGPGSYNTFDSCFGKAAAFKPHYQQVFGSNVARFKEKPIGSHLGPGEYKLPGRGRRFSPLQMAGSAAFRSKPRGSIVDLTNFDLPGPGEYSNDLINNAMTFKLASNANTNAKQAFGGYQKRFEKADTLPPGPGQYIQSEVEVCAKHAPGKKVVSVDARSPKHTVLASTCNKTGPQLEFASYRSITDRDLNNIIG
jgi:hypothetical protein